MKGRSGTRRGAALALLLAVVMALGAACTREETPVVTLMTHDSFDISAPVLAAFEQEHEVTLRILKAGDAGAALNQAILSKKNPLADVFFGVDNTFMSRALTEDIFEPYASPHLADIPDELELDPAHRVLPVDYGDVCLNYDKAWFASRDLSPPQGLEDLVRPAYRGLTVVENPATSSPGLVFLLITVARFGEEGWLDYWKALKRNEVLVASGWEDAYWGQFSAASSGTRPIVVSYATSPPAEVHFAKEPLKEAPTAALVAPGSAFRQVEFVGILKGTRNPKLSRALVDFLLDVPFQEDIPLSMFVFPANARARLPEVFRRHAHPAERPVRLAPEAIAKGREAWIEAWTQAMLN